MDTKPVLFLDFDGLKFDTLDIHVRYINHRYGISTVPADYIDNPGLEDVIKKYFDQKHHHLIDRDEVYLDVGERLIASLEWHKDVPPIPGMAEIIPLLAKKYTLWTVTARQKTSLPVVKHMLDTYVPNCISGVHCVWEHLGEKRWKEVSKKQFIEQFPGPKVAFIDDSPKEILRMEGIISTYLFDRHGMHSNASGITNIVRTWHEIGKVFL